MLHHNMINLGKGVSLSPTHPPTTNMSFNPITPGDGLTASGGQWSVSAVPTCKAYRSGSQAITNGLWTTVVLNGEVEDAPGWHSNVTNPSRITVDTDGLFLVVWWATFAINTTGVRLGRIQLNGGDAGLDSASIYGDTSSEFTTSIGNSSVMRMSSGDYVELAVYQSSGGNLNLLGGTSYNSGTTLSVTRLGS